MTPSSRNADGADPAASGEVEMPIEVEEFVGWLRAERGRAPSTIEAYRRDLRRYLTFLRTAGVGLDMVDEATLVRYVRMLQAQDLAPATVTRCVVVVRSLHRFLAREGLAAEDPATALEVPPVPAALPKALRIDEIDRLLAAASGASPTDLRDRALLELLYGSGLRISEAVGLSLGGLDLDARLVRVLGKGSKERVVPIGRVSHDALAAWLGAEGRALLAPEHARSRSDADAVFLNARGGRLSRQGAWGVVRKHARTAGLADRLTPHTLRHSCATHMLDHGADIRVVQELLGHASIRTTQVYTKVTRERLWETYRRSHPRAEAER